VPVAAENTGVNGAGGRFGALCARGAAENTAAGALPDGEAVERVVPVLTAGAAVVDRWLNGCVLGRGEAGALGCDAGAVENTAGGAPPAGAAAGAAGIAGSLKVGAVLFPAGTSSGVWVAGAALNATGPAGAGDGRDGPGRGGRDGCAVPGRGGRGPGRPGTRRGAVPAVPAAAFAPPRMPAIAPRVLMVRIVLTS
jgi:hypothetical protein